MKPNSSPCGYLVKPRAKLVGKCKLLQQAPCPLGTRCQIDGHKCKAGQFACGYYILVKQS